MQGMEISCSVRLVGGSQVIESNIDRIKAMGRFDGGNYLGGIRLTGEQIHSVKTESEGYIFRCDKTGAGLNGHHKTLRELVVSTILSCGSKRKVVVL